MTYSSGRNLLFFQNTFPNEMHPSDIATALAIQLWECHYLSSLSIIFRTFETFALPVTGRPDNAASWTDSVQKFLFPPKKKKK